jgi:pyruvate dehydrogenase E2 component (dihydrolipoyllysine-residue acetyltransferase)
MRYEIKMPKLGFDMESGTIVRWIKQKGDYVEAGKPVLEVETDKATIEVEALNSGLLTDILAKEGDTVPVGVPVGILDSEEIKTLEALSPQETLGSSLSPASESNRATEARRLTSEEKPAESNGGGPIAISPLARKIAKEDGVDVYGIEGTGPRGMIVKKDILKFIQSTQKRPGREEPSYPVEESAETDAQSALSGTQRTPLSKMRQAIARRMVHAFTTIPHFTVSMGVAMSKSMDLRKSYNAVHPEEQHLSVNDLIVRAAALALRKYPRLNSTFDEDALEMHAEINVGIAVALDEGLITVVIPNVGHKALSQIAVETREVIRRAKEGKLRPQDLEGGTFTVSNLGMFGVDKFTALINPPEAAILAVGAVQETPWNVDGAIVLQPRMELTLSVDHRVSDGAEAARFLRVARNYLEEPMLMI